LSTKIKKILEYPQPTVHCLVPPSQKLGDNNVIMPTGFFRVF